MVRTKAKKKPANLNMYTDSNEQSNKYRYRLEMYKSMLMSKIVSQHRHYLQFYNN
jgi:hypothetical protein